MSNKWIAEFELEDGDTMPKHMDLEYKGAKIDFHCKPLEQEPNRDTEEIAEIMKCDADAETKCKMISNILTAKPHYFAEQESTYYPPCIDCKKKMDEIRRAYDKLKEQESSEVEQSYNKGFEDCRQAVLDVVFESRKNFNNEFDRGFFADKIRDLPPVRPQEPIQEQWQELKETIIEMRDNDGTGTQQEVCKFLVNYMEVLEKQMVEPQAESEDKE